MRLSCRQSDGILLGLFHTTKETPIVVARLTLEIKDEFQRSFHALHEELRAALDSIADEKAQDMMTEDEVLLRFKGFDGQVDDIVSRVLPEQADNGGDEGVSETEESDSKKTSNSRERKREPEEGAPSP